MSAVCAACAFSSGVISSSDEKNLCKSFMLIRRSVPSSIVSRRIGSILSPRSFAIFSNSPYWLLGTSTSSAVPSFPLTRYVNTGSGVSPFCFATALNSSISSCGT